MGKYFLIWSCTIDCCRNNQRRVEPATILVGAFKVQITWIIIASCGQFIPGRTGVKPYVHDVLFLCKQTIWRFFIHITIRQKILCFTFKPDIGTMLFKQIGDVFKYFHIHDRRTVFTIDDRNRYTPKTLSGNTPVTTIGNHVMHSLLAEVVMPFDLIVDFIQQLWLDLINGTEPLLDRSENNLLFQSVIMRIAVSDVFYCKQTSLFIHIMNDCLGAVFKEHTAVLACFFIHVTLIINCIDWS